MKFAARAVASRLAGYIENAISSLLLVALQDDRGDAQVPCQVLHQKRGKTHSLTPGLVSSAMLCLPRVANSVLTTAQQHHIRITTTPPAPPPEALQKLLERLHKHEPAVDQVGRQPRRRHPTGAAPQDG